MRGTDRPRYRTKAVEKQLFQNGYVTHGQVLCYEFLDFIYQAATKL